MNRRRTYEVSVRGASVDVMVVVKSLVILVVITEVLAGCVLVSVIIVPDINVRANPHPYKHKRQISG